MCEWSGGDGQREREDLKQIPCSVGSPVQGSISAPWNHDPSRNQSWTINRLNHAHASYCWFSKSILPLLTLRFEFFGAHGCSGGVCAREQAKSSQSWMEDSRCSAHDHGQERGLVGCDVLDIPLLSGLFWSGGWNVPIIAKCLCASRKCYKKEIQWVSVTRWIKQSCLFLVNYWHL